MKTHVTLMALFLSVVISAQTPPCRTPYLDLSTGKNHETNQSYSFNETDPFWQISNGPAWYDPYPHCVVSTGSSAGALFQNSKAITLSNSFLTGNMLPGTNDCNYTDQPYLFERNIEVYTGPSNPAVEVTLSIEQITANFSLSSVILNGPGGPFVIFPGCLNNQTSMLPNTVMYLQTGHYTLQVNVGNEWGVNYNPTTMYFQMKASIYSSSSIFSDNQHYGRHSTCSQPYLLPQTPVFANDCFIPPSTQTEVTIDNFQPSMNYSITPSVSSFSSSFMANANTTYTVTVQDSYGCSLSTTTIILPCLMDHFKMKIFIEGLYLLSGEMKPLKYLIGLSNDISDVDDVTVRLHEAQSPYYTILSTSATLHSDGFVEFTFPLISGGLFYVEVIYKNALTVWSSTTISLHNDALLDLTLNPTSVIGLAEMAVSPNTFALISGDINQDHSIDWFDSLILITDIENGNTGYLGTDLNGDGSVDAFDYLILYPKMGAGLSSVFSP